MNVTWPPAGRYLLAVSGGADSMVLLDLLAGVAAERGYELVVAHFDHGLRPGSPADSQFVRGAARRYGLPCVHHAARLGTASEATARAARHAWLEAQRAQASAAAVVTAHHQDDLIETSLLNLARGTGRRGLAPMQDGPVRRPLLACSRAELRAYAAARRLVWRDDPTNADRTNPRNWLRHELLPYATPAWRAAYLERLGRLAGLNATIDRDLAARLEVHRVGERAYRFPRVTLRQLALPELESLLVALAGQLQPGATQLSRRTVQELALFALTARPHRRRLLRRGLEVVAGRDSISVLAF